MLLAEKGILSKAQAFTANGSGAVSSNVILIPAVAGVAPTDLWLAVETAVAAGGGTSSTYKIQLLVDTAASLASDPKEVLSVLITGAADARIATAGKPILAVNIGKMLAQLMSATVIYVGAWITLADGNGTASLSINAALSNSEPRTEDKSQIVDSPVGVPETL